MVTPRLFVEGANVIEASFNFISRIADSWRSLACVPIWMASYLSGFNCKPLNEYHQCSSLKHSLTAVNAASLRKAMYNCVSSAYCRWLTAYLDITLAAGETYNVNSSGPRTEPCGTPDSHCTANDVSPPTRMDCDRLSTYDRSQSRALPVIPKVFSSRRNRVSWLMQSKAADRSSSTSSDLDPLSAALYTSFSSRTIAF